MSRLFAGGTDLMTYSPVDWAFGTLLIVGKIATTNDASWLSFIEGEASGGTTNYALGRHNSGPIYMSNNATLSKGSQAIQDADGWCIFAVTKATGTAAPIMYKIPIGGTRINSTGDVSLANSPAIVAGGGRIRIAGNDDPANMYIAAVAIFNGTVLTGAQLDGINTAKTTASINALGPTWLIDDSDSLATDLTAGTADRTAISGTTSSADNPSSWVYGLGGGTSHALAGTSAGTSTSTGAVTVTHPLAGTSAGTSTSTGAVAVTHPLAGTSAGTSTSVGALTVAHPLAGTSAGTSATTGDLSVSHSLAGTSAGSSTSVGNLTVTAGGVQALAGTSAGSSTSTGALSVAHSLAGESDGSSFDTAAVSANYAVAGISDGNSTSVGFVAVNYSLAGISAGSSSSAGALVVGTTLGTVLNHADAVYYGGAAADAVYAGTQKVWP
jgi:hypothetical protein